MEQTSINFGDVVVMEPVTALTDLLVAGVCFFAFSRLNRHTDSQGHFIKLYRYFFFTMGLTTSFGGIIGHAFLHYLSFGWKLPGWIMSMLSIALAERAAIIHCQPLLKKRPGILFPIINILELFTFIFIVMYTLNFTYVEVHAVYGLVVVLFSFEFFVYKKTADEGSLLALWSIFFAFAAMMVHLTKLSIHKWFNYFDLSHVFLAISSYVLYLGVKTMKLHKGKNKLLV